MQRTGSRRDIDVADGRFSRGELLPGIRAVVIAGLRASAAPFAAGSHGYGAVRFSRHFEGCFRARLAPATAAAQDDTASLDFQCAVKTEQDSRGGENPTR
jgi:hypothetical protein